MEKPALALEDGLDLRKVVTSGSLIQINADYNDSEYKAEKTQIKPVAFIGLPVKSFEDLEKQMFPVDPDGLIKKKTLEEGGGMPLHKGCTVHIAFSGFWENVPEPFDVRLPDKPLIVDLSDSGLLPGLEIAVKSMLVGETSVFLLSYKVMYGELGIPPRIKRKADCIFFIKLVKNILTPNAGQINYSEGNIFQRVHHDVRLLYASGITLYKSKNTTAAIQLFKKAVNMLHNCRLADEEEEKIQEKMLKKLYMNQAVCYNATRQPLKACTACNELHRLNHLWNNGKALYQNAKALRMIGEFDAAEKKLTRAIKLCPNSKELDEEFNLLTTIRNSCNNSNLIRNRIETRPSSVEVGDDFKREVDILIKNFKENVDLCKFNLPEGLNSSEIEYIKQVCLKEDLYINRVQRNFALDKDKALTIGNRDTQVDEYHDDE